MTERNRNIKKSKIQRNAEYCAVLALALVLFSTLFFHTYETNLLKVGGYCLVTFLCVVGFILSVGATIETKMPVRLKYIIYILIYIWLPCSLLLNMFVGLL